MPKGVVFPQNIQKESMVEKPIGQQQYWYDLLMGDMATSQRRLLNILNFSNTADQITSSKEAMQLIIDGKITLDDKKEQDVVVDGCASTTTDIYTVPENHILILTKVKFYNSNGNDSFKTRFRINHSGTIKSYTFDGLYPYFSTYMHYSKTLQPEERIEHSIFKLLKAGDILTIVPNSNAIKHTFTGILVDASLLDVYLNTKYCFGQGLDIEYGNSKLTNLKQVSTVNDLLVSQSALEESFNNDDIFNFLDKFVGEDNICTSTTNTIKWVAKKVGLTPKEVNSFLDIYPYVNSLMDTENNKRIIAFKCYSDEDMINEILNSDDINEFSIMHNNELLISKALDNNRINDSDLISTGDYNNINQGDEYFQIVLSGSETERRSSIHYSREVFDLTNINEIIFTVKRDYPTSYTYPYYYMGVYSNNSNASHSSYSAYIVAYSPDSDYVDVSVDVSSLSGKYYLKFSMYDSSTSTRKYGYMKIKDIIFKK